MVNRNAVLPQFMTWLNQVGAVSSSLKFLGTCPVYRSENNLQSSRIKQSIDQKTLLAVTNVAARPYSYILGGDPRSGQDEPIDRGSSEGDRVHRAIGLDDFLSREGNRSILLLHPGCHHSIGILSRSTPPMTIL